MNNRGQSLVLFVLILPIIILLLAVFIDMSLATYQKSKIESIGKTIAYNAINENLDIKEVNNLIDKNIKELVYKKVNIIDDILYIELSGQQKSIFGNILKFKVYDTKVLLKANYITKKINIGE